MPSLMELPSDLIPFVFIYLSQGDFHSLAQVSRHLYRESEPYLYHDVTFTATKSFRCARKLALLLRTLLEQPHLASLIRSFKLCGPHACWNKYNPWPVPQAESPLNLWGLEGCPILSKTQMIFASSQFYQLVDKEMHRTPAQFKGRSKDALAIMALTRLTQLDSLEVEEGFMTYSLFLPQILQRSQNLFPKIRHVALGDRKADPENAFAYMDLDIIRPIFYTPTVESFELRMTQPWHFGWKSPNAPRSESLTTFHLFRSNIRRDLLTEILSAMPQLKEFCYEHEMLFQPTMTAQSSPSLFTNLHGLNDALGNVQQTLEVLGLSLKLDPSYASSTEFQTRTSQYLTIQGTLTSLKKMEKLTTIDIPMIMILGWVPDFAARVEEVIPSSVEDLTLSDDFLSFCPWVSGFNCFRKIGLIGEFLEHRKTHAPKLKKFRLRLTEPKKNLWLEDAISDMRALVNGTGAHYEMLHNGLETHHWRFDAV